MQLPQNININKYSKDWRPHCIEAFTSNVPSYFTEAEIAQFEDWLNLLEEDQSQHHYYTAVANDMVIACGGFSYNVDGNNVTFAWGLVHRDFHKQGIGKLLLTYRLNKIRELYSDVDVLLDTTQYSMPFFERYGFVTVKYTEDGYTKGMHRYDMVLKIGSNLSIEQ